MKRYFCLLIVLFLLAAGMLAPSLRGDTAGAAPSRHGGRRGLAAPDAPVSLDRGAGFRRENIAVRQLDNGLKILLYEDHDIPNIAYYTFFRVGSRN